MQIETLRSKASEKFGMKIPHHTLISSNGADSRETLASQALFHVHLAATAGDPPLTKRQAVGIALFGVPIWMIFVRMFLKKLALWAFRELTKKEPRC